MYLYCRSWLPPTTDASSLSLLAGAYKPREENPEIKASSCAGHPSWLPYVLYEYL